LARARAAFNFQRPAVYYMGHLMRVFAVIGHRPSASHGAQAPAGVLWSQLRSSAIGPTPPMRAHAAAPCPMPHAAGLGHQHQLTSNEHQLLKEQRSGRGPSGSAPVPSGAQWRSRCRYKHLRRSQSQSCTVVSNSAAIVMARLARPIAMQAAPPTPPPKPTLSQQIVDICKLQKKARSVREVSVHTVMMVLHTSCCCPS
jgi:hypothetical protein